MNRMLRPFIAGGLISAACVTAAGCADNNSTLFVYGVLKAIPPTCQVTADPSQPMLGSGIVDLAIRTNYAAWLLVGNQYSPRGAKQQLKTETTRVTLTGADITLTDAATNSTITCPGTPSCGDFSVHGSGFANSSKGEDPGWGAMEAQLVPNAVGEFYLNQAGGPLATQSLNTVGLVATVRVYGTTLGGQDIESGPFSFPVQLCNGCLIDYSAASAAPPGKCAPKENEIIPDTSCRPGQDDKIDCRSCHATLACQQVYPPIVP